MSIVERIMQALRARGYTITGEGEADGIIVTLALPSGAAAALAVPGGEAPGELHVTLAYLGKSSDLTEADVARYAALAQALAAEAARQDALELSCQRHHVFPGANDGMDACVVDVTAPGLNELRERVMDLCDQAGTPGSRKFPDFHPHVTLAYVYPDEPHPTRGLNRAPVRIPDLQLWIGGKHVAFPFGQVLSKADQGAAPALPGTQQAKHMLAQLTGDLIQLHRAERTARTQTDAVRAHHAERVDALAQVIRAPRGSAVEDALFDHAREAHQARTLADL